MAAVDQRCKERPRQLSADSGFFTLDNLHAVEAQGINVYMPDAVLAKELHQGPRVKGAGPRARRSPSAPATEVAQCRRSSRV